jgi:superfamily II DNA/RNA helicase
MSSFEKLDLRNDLLAFLGEAELTEPTPIQKQAIPRLLKGESLCALAPTGTGKTLAYALAMVQRLKDSEKECEATPGHPRGIILAPTRELATQVHGILKSISHHAKLRVRALTGGSGPGKNVALRSQLIDVLVVGPTRLAHTIARKELSLSKLEFMVLDEADQLLDPSFAKDLQAIWLAAKESRTSLALFSATEPPDFNEFIVKLFGEQKLARLAVEGAGQLKREVETYNIFIQPKEKISMTELFLKEKAQGHGVIFVNRRETVDSLIESLKKSLPAKRFIALHGEMTKEERKKNFDRFRKTGGVLIASDIAARGIDFDNLSWVLNFDLPFEPVYYVHRVGRVARGENKGLVFNLVIPADRKIVTRINKSIEEQTALVLGAIDMPKETKKVAEARVSARAKAAAAKKEPVKKRPVLKPKRTPRYKRK